MPVGALLLPGLGGERGRGKDNMARITHAVYMMDFFDNETFLPLAVPCSAKLSTCPSTSTFGRLPLNIILILQLELRCKLMINRYEYGWVRQLIQKLLELTHGMWIYTAITISPYGTTQEML